MPSHFIIQHPPTEQQEVILIDRDDAFQFADQAIIRMFLMHREDETACLVHFQFKGRIVNRQASHARVIQEIPVTIDPIHHKSPSCHVKEIVPLPVTVTMLSPSTSSISGMLNVPARFVHVPSPKDIVMSDVVVMVGTARFLAFVKLTVSVPSIARVTTVSAILYLYGSQSHSTVILPTLFSFVYFDTKHRPT